MRFRNLMRNEQGASAIEFALAAPFLCFGLLAMADVAMQIATRMELDRNVRAGAQAAMTLYNPGPVIERIVRTAAHDPDLDVMVTEGCACSVEAVGTCPMSCADGESSFFYVIEARRPHHGPLFKDVTIASRAHVQVR